MTKTIARLWGSNLIPAERFGEGNREMKELEELIKWNAERMKKLLDQRSKDIISPYVDCVDEYLKLSNEQAFCDGFCLGARLLAEAMCAAD